MLRPSNPAFEAYFRREFRGRPEAGAKYLQALILNGPSDTVAWEYIDATGDGTYDADTFIRAARFILEAEK